MGFECFRSFVCKCDVGDIFDFYAYPVSIGFTTPPPSGNGQSLVRAPALCDVFRGDRQSSAGDWEVPLTLWPDEPHTIRMTLRTIGEGRDDMVYYLFHGYDPTDISQRRMALVDPVDQSIIHEAAIDWFRVTQAKDYWAISCASDGIYGTTANLTPSIYPAIGVGFIKGGVITTGGSITYMNHNGGLATFLLPRPPNPFTSNYTGLAVPRPFTLAQRQATTAAGMQFNFTAKNTGGGFELTSCNAKIGVGSWLKQSPPEMTFDTIVDESSEFVYVGEAGNFSGNWKLYYVQCFRPIAFDAHGDSFVLLYYRSWAPIGVNTATGAQDGLPGLPIPGSLNHEVVISHNGGQRVVLTYPYNSQPTSGMHPITVALDIEGGSYFATHDLIGSLNYMTELYGQWEYEHAGFGHSIKRSDRFCYVRESSEKGWAIDRNGNAYETYLRVQENPHYKPFPAMFANATYVAAGSPNLDVYPDVARGGFTNQDMLVDPVYYSDQFSPTVELMGRHPPLT